MKTFKKRRGSDAREWVRTTVRIPNELYLRLRRATPEHGTAEEIIQQALTRSLDDLCGAAVRTIVVPEVMDPLLAEIVVQALPAFCDIKDRNGRILFANLYMLDRLGKSADELRGKTTIDAGLVAGELAVDEVREHIRDALRGRKPEMVKENILVKGLGLTLVRTFRFTEPKGLLGDFSFIEQEITTREAEDLNTVSRMSRLPAPGPEIQRALLSMLECAPLAFALKKWAGNRVGSKIEWSNAEFKALVHAGQKRRRVAQTPVDQELTDRLFAPEVAEAIRRLEERVVKTGSGHVAKTDISGVGPRWSIRFPIVDTAGQVQFIGVVSPDFRRGTLTGGPPKKAR